MKLMIVLLPATLLLSIIAACRPQSSNHNDLTLYGFKGKVKAIKLHLQYKNAAGKGLMTTEQDIYFNPEGNRDSVLFHTPNGMIKDGKRVFTNLKNGDATWSQANNSGNQLSRGTVHWITDKLSVEQGTYGYKEGHYTDSTELNNDYRLVRTMHYEYSHDSLTDYTITRYDVDSQGRPQHITTISPNRQTDSTFTNITTEGYNAMGNPLKITQQSTELTSEWHRSYTYYERQ